MDLATDGTTGSTTQTPAVTFDDGCEDVVTLIVPERMMDHRKSTQVSRVPSPHPTLPDTLSIGETRYGS